MSRIHHRDSRGDWSLEADYGYAHPNLGQFFVTSSSPRYRLSVRMTTEQASALLDSSMDRGCMSFEHSMSYGGTLMVRDIEVTADEANRIAHGEHPLDVLAVGPWPGFGYRLRAVRDDPKTWATT